MEIPRDMVQGLQISAPLSITLHSQVAEEAMSGESLQNNPLEFFRWLYTVHRNEIHTFDGWGYHIEFFIGDVRWERDAARLIWYVAVNCDVTLIRAGDADYRRRPLINYGGGFYVSTSPPPLPSTKSSPPPAKPDPVVKKKRVLEID